MSKKKIVPYVEIIVNPKLRRKRQLSPSPIEPPSLLPRKKRKFADYGPSEDSSSYLTKTKSTLVRQLSPTASESGIDSRIPPPSSSSPTLFQRDTDSETTEEDTPESVVYTSTNVLVEDEDMMVHGETPLDDDERDAGDLPVRLLEDFVIYDMNSVEAVPVASLMEIPYTTREFSASGLVKAWMEKDSDDEDDLDSLEEGDDDRSLSLEPEWDRVSLSRIIEFSIHSPGDTKGELDSKIYIKTEFAWYILGTPASEYRPYFKPFWVKHRIFHLLVVTSCDNSRLTYDEFKSNLQQLDEAEESVASSFSIFRRKLMPQDFESPEALAYISSTLQELHCQRVIQISRVPAIREILGPQHYDDSVDISPKKVQSKPKRRAPKIVEDAGSFSKRIKPAGKTFLTPIVNSIAQDLFKGSLEVAKSNIYGEHVASGKRRDHKAHHTNPSKIVWGNRLVEDDDLYESVIVDGVTYRIGDVVMVEPGDHGSKAKTGSASHTLNKYGDRWWFCQIQYFYKEVEGQHVSKMFHGQWFVHGCKTILQETSHSKALYLLKGSCDDNQISSIFQKCNLSILRQDEEEVPDDGCHDANDFHCALMYDDDLTSFEDLPPDALSIKEWDCRSCYSCTLKEEAAAKKEVRLSKEEDEVTVYGEIYHLHDFVYIHPSGGDQVLHIGQIVGLDRHKVMTSVQVRFLGRYDDYVLEQRRKDRSGFSSDLTFDERRLFYSDDIKAVPVPRLEGKCQVRHMTEEDKIEDWVSHDDHFYLNQVGDTDELRPMKKRDFGYCGECRADDERQRSQRERFLKLNSKLIGMELFSGAGGLGIGMDLSQFVETKYAVEYEPSAAKTYKLNHPDTTVYCQDSSQLLKRAVAVMNKENPEPLLSNGGKTYCPQMPKKNEQIDFIFGGPPCQSFSKANHSKRHDDIRSTLSCNMLSYVEHYDPKYFLLENVAGFLEHQFHSSQLTSEGKEVDCTIKFGMVKLVTRTLIALGYQVKYRLLQCGQYGVPQSRNRVIFWGAKRGLAIPDFPLPAYAFPRGASRVTLPTEGKLEPASRSKNPNEYHYFAPLKFITVDGATSDLPPFEWENPHDIIPVTPRDRAETRKRQDVLGITQFCADIGKGDKEFENLPGYPEGAEYAKPPQNRYQKWLRRGVKVEDEHGSAKALTAHYTDRWGKKVIEATANVPLKALADHRDLDDVFLPERARRKARHNQLVLYGRLDPNGYFRCAVTTLSPVVKNQWPLHPSQKRVISVREAARAQGFPDTYIFHSVNTEAGTVVKDQLRQIGNAVSVPFALALGKELGKALMKDWERKEREGSVDL